ncbi:FKBP-type peptidyl-prolyl cis-trans isomerase [Pedobacter sp. L105]|uniref:FKBP-type peptidyl-prolyl cis-trans isomerase n=1 Tax=Pedobacter sp. L105 TaxID=1641871 RepID=UPI00131DAC69|nr:FKBP-type peptidyl-prolyl cis-trans isomerase [Pedobacter sp. L105]
MAQKDIKPLTLGDNLPEITINKIINSNLQSFKTSDFKNQLLIIDFWETTCSGCVASLPRYDTLQHQFNYKIKILPVTDEPGTLTVNFWRRNKYTKNVHLPSVIEDKVFSLYFPHKSIPHEVWVNKGKIIAITSSEYVDAYHIKKVLNDEKVDWPLKYDFYSFNGSKQSLFILDSNQVDVKSTAVKYSAISDYREKVNSEGFSGGAGVIRDANSKTVRAYFLNQPIYTSYIQSFAKIVSMDSLVKPSYLVDPNQIVWEVSDRSKYKYETKSGYTQDWIRIHGICFESVNPDTGQADIMVYKSIVNDLDRLLGLHVRWEKRNEKVLKLIITSKSDLLSKHNFNHKNFLQTLVYQLNQKENNPYVFDETGYSEEVNIDFNFSSWTDIQNIRKTIQPYGLDLIEEKRLVDKLIFTEVDGGMVLDSKMMKDADARRRTSIQQAKTIDPTDNKSFLEINKRKVGVVNTPSGLQYKILKQGNGTKPIGNERVSVQYTGMLINGQVFESSFEKGKPFITNTTDVIQGWKEALAGMSVGSKWILYVPAELAYGEHTMRGTIPPNSTLIFELELLQIIK